MDRSPWDWLLNQEWVGLAIAGGAGGLVRWLSMRESMVEGAISIVVGSLSAIYLGPIVGAWVPGSPANALGFAGFATGIAGVGVVGWVMDIWKVWQKRLGVSNGE